MGKKERKSYVGVTGFMSADEVQKVLDNVDLKSADRQLMVGVLVGLKTLKGEPNKFPNRYPQAADIAGIFPNNPDCLNLVHYATNEPETLLDQLIEVTKLAGPHLDGFQLNVTWPDPVVLKKYKDLYPDKVFVFAVSGKVFESVNHSPELLAIRLQRDYGSLIDYVLLDPSGGHGKSFDAAVARTYLDWLVTIKNPKQLGAAGGLSDTTLDVVEPLTGDYPGLNVDAEGRVRTPKPEDKLDVDAAIRYVQGVLKMFSALASS